MTCLQSLETVKKSPLTFAELSKVVKKQLSDKAPDGMEFALRGQRFLTVLGCLAFPVSHGGSKWIQSWSWNSGSPLAGGTKVSIQSICALSTGGTEGGSTN